MADLTNINFSQGFQNHLGGNPIGSSSAKSSKRGSVLLSALRPIGAGIDMASGVAGALDSIFGWSAKRQHRMQKELMDKQQDQWKQQQEILNKAQLDQWNRENEYNDPTNYLKRLLDGADNNGLSKAAVLGELAGGSVGMSATGVSAPGSTSMTGAGGSTLLPFGSSNVLGAMRQRAEIANIEADTNKKESESGLVDAQRASENLRQTEQFYLNRVASLLPREKQLNLDLLGIRKASDTFLLSKQPVDWSRDYEKKGAEINELFERARSHVSNADLSEAKIQEVLSNINLIESSIALNWAYHRLTESQAGLSENELKLVKSNFSWLSFNMMRSAQISDVTYQNLSIEGNIKRKELKNWGYQHNFLGTVDSFANLIGAASGFVSPISINLGKRRKIGF